MEEMEEIRESLMNEFDKLFDFDDAFVHQGEKGFYASWPEHPPKNDVASRVARVSEKHKGVSFVLAGAYHEGCDVVREYDTFKDGESKGSESVLG